MTDNRSGATRRIIKALIAETTELKESAAQLDELVPAMIDAWETRLKKLQDENKKLKDSILELEKFACRIHYAGEFCLAIQRLADTVREPIPPQESE
jgi:alanyl-tRNA synthetase